MESRRVEISADFLRGATGHQHLSYIVAKYAIARVRRLCDELGDELQGFLNSLQTLTEDRLREPKKGEPGYKDYEDKVAQVGPDGTCVFYVDQEPERGSWGYWETSATTLVLIAVETIIDDTPTRHYLVVSWNKETARWVPVVSEGDKPQLGHVFAVLDESSQGLLEVAPRIDDVLRILTGGHP